VPALPDALFARARHHMVSVGRVLLLNCDAATLRFAMGDNAPEKADACPKRPIKISPHFLNKAPAAAPYSGGL
jgi:hypothetical protein